MQVNVFGKNDCAKCETTKHKVSHFLAKCGVAHAVELNFVDMDSIDGMAEGAFQDVHEVPTTIIEADGQAVARWDGAIPDSKALKAHFIGIA